MMSTSRMWDYKDKIVQEILAWRKEWKRKASNREDDRWYLTVMIDSLWRSSNINNNQRDNVRDEDILDKTVIDTLKVFCDIFGKHLTGNPNAQNILRR